MSIQFSSGYLDDKQTPKIKAIHPQVNEHTVKVGLSEQMENIANNWLQYRWPLLTCRNEDRPLTKLEKLGYERGFCEEALEEFKDFEKTSSWLSENINTLRQSIKDMKPNSKEQSSPFALQRQAVEKLLNKVPLSFKKLIESGKSQLAIAVVLKNNGSNLEKTIETIMDAGGIIQNAPQLLSNRSEGNNFIIELLQYLLIRMTTVMGHCLICDNLINVEGYEGFNPLKGLK